MTKISKILYIVTQSEQGGAQHYVFDLASSYKSQGLEVLVAAGGNGVLFQKLENLGIKTFHLPHLVREISPLNDFLAVKGITRLIKAEKPDIVHLNSSKVSIVGSIASFLAKKKASHRLIYTVHGFVFNEPMGQLKKNFYLFLERFTARFKDKLICITEFEEQMATKHRICSSDKLVVINNGLNDLEFLTKIEARTELGLPLDKFIIGNIANFYPAKNLSLAVKTMASVVKTKPEAIFALIGDGQLRNELTREIEGLRLTDNFILLGSRSNAYRYLKAFDLFCLTSVKEGMPFAVLEAMQASLPIIVPAVGGLPEIINQKNGLLVPVNDREILAENIIKLMANDNLRQELAQNAQTDFQARFTMQAMTDDTLKVYQL